MKSSDSLLFVTGILSLIAIAYACFYSKQNPFLDKHLLTRGMDKPTIWLYYDHSDVQSREWADFGARSSRALNIPFLNLCYESILRHNQNDYHIEVVSGLIGVAERLGGWEQLPPGLRDPIAPVNQAEMDWIRAALLSKYGGLWLTPHTVCVKGFGPLPAEKCVFFGTDLEETLAGSEGTPVPGLRAIWSPRPAHPLFSSWANLCYERVATKKGGEQIRGDAKWDFIRLSKEFVGTGITIDPHAECGRKSNGKRIQLEDLLATGTDGHLPFEVYPHTVYVPFPWTELRDRKLFGWFLRMSEEQIMESDLAVKYLL